VEPIFIIIVVFAGIAMIVLGYIEHKRTERRRAEIFLLSQQLGFEFFPFGSTTEKSDFWSRIWTGDVSNSPNFLSRFSGFDPFDRGHSRVVQNLLVGRRNGLDCYVFDYQYKVTSGGGKNRRTTTYNHGIVAMRVPLALPSISLEPENLLHRLGSKLGMSELTFEYEEFNRRYWIRASSERHAYDILHPQAIDYLMRHPVRHWQMSGPYMLIMQNGRFQPMEIRRILDEIEGFYDLIPQYVHQDRGLQANWQGPLD
jgi:hypothetical protein